MRSLALALACLAAACNKPSNPPHTAAPEAVGQDCIDCHEEIVSYYRQTGMAHAVEGLRPGEAQELATLASVPDSDTGLSYRFEARGEEVWISESVRARLIERAPVAFAVGAGLMDRSFVLERGGTWWFAPLEVISDESENRHAALAPGHEIRPGSRFETPITEECLGCHTDALPRRDYPLNAADEDWMPSGISCAACHGPGQGHVRWRNAEAPVGSDPILNPADFELEERMSVCARCHLQGDARFGLAAGARGVAPLGGDLLEHRAIFVAADPSDEIGFVSHTERLVRSACYTASKARGRGLDCTSCHDPHRSVFDPEETRVVRQACLACHPRGSSMGETDAARACGLELSARASQDCVSCHMQRLQPFDVAGVRIHDHFIRSRIGPEPRIEALRALETTGGELQPFRWPGGEPRAWQDDRGIEMMAYAGAKLREAAKRRVDTIAGPSATGTPMYHHLRASLLEELGRGDEARQAYEAALELDPELAETQVNLGLLLGDRGRLDRLIARHPRAEGALRNRALIRLSAGDARGAIDDLERAHALRPGAALARTLAQLCVREGRSDEAERWAREMTRLLPR